MSTAVWIELYLLAQPEDMFSCNEAHKISWTYLFNAPDNADVYYIEDIYSFEVKTKYISSSVLKTSECSRVRSTGENFNVFNSRDDIFGVF